MVASSGILWALVAVILQPIVDAAVDSGDFAVELPVEVPYSSDGIPPFVDFSAPVNGAATYIASSTKWKPSYSAKYPLRPTSEVCDGQYATPCSIQAAIDLVARAMEDACFLYSFFGDVSTLLMEVATVTSELSSTPNLGLFVLDKNFTIIADTLESSLVGEPIDGLAASGRSVQPRLRERLLSVVGSATGSSSNGGFVPHLSTRLSTLSTDSADGYKTPVETSSYFERCVGSAEQEVYIGASVRRQALPGEAACDFDYNNNCNIYNAQSAIGLTLLDFLSVKDEDDYQHLLYETAYGASYSAGSFSPILAQVEPDPTLDSFLSLNPTAGTILADKSNRSNMGLNLTVFDDYFGPLALRGGGWQKTVYSYEDINWDTYMWETVSIYKATLVAGVVFDGTAHAIVAGGFSHTPQKLTTDFQCAACDATLQACAFQTIQYLSSHVQTDFLLADNSSDALWRITNLAWLGAHHTNASTPTIDGVEHDAHWPIGFSLALFDSDGVCVADGADPTRVGEHFDSRAGGGEEATPTTTTAGGWFERRLEEERDESAPARALSSVSWESLVTGAANGVGYIAYDDNATGVPMFAKVTKMMRFDQEFYMVAAVPSIAPALGNCSFDIVEPCVGAWIEAEATRWATTLALLEPSMWLTGAISLMDEFPFGDGLWAGVWGADWDNLLPTNNWRVWGIRSKIQTLSSDAVETLNATSSTRGGWATMPNHTDHSPHKAFVLSFRHNASSEIRVVIGFHGQLGEPFCDTHDDCGSSQYCASNGTCACNPDKLYYKRMDTSCRQGFGKTVLSCQYKEGSVWCPDFDDLVECNFCVAGHYCPTNYVSFECPEGYYCPAKSRTPLPCPAGTWTQGNLADNETDCIPCEPGNYRDSSTLTGCQACPSGSFQAEFGETSCNRCDYGSYQNSTGASSCFVCDHGMTTDGTGFTTATDCICPSNTYAVLDGDTVSKCQSCGTGSHCPGYGRDPEAQSGYYLDEITPSGLSIFECKDPIYCPGGTLQTCSEGRTGIACARCFDDMTPSNDGSCRDCVFLDKFLLWGGATALAIALIVLYIGVATSDRSKQNHSTLLVVISASQVVTMAQTLNVLASMQVQWKKPLVTFLELFKFMAFDITELRVSCHFNTNPFDSYLLRLLVPIMALVFVSIIHCIATVIWYSSHFGARFPTLLGASGSIFLAFSISVVLATLMPAQCVQHPNGLWTIHQEMSELCWEGSRHSAMIAAAGVACILPVLFLTAVLYILQSFPQKMRDGDVRFLNTAQFLLFRYKPNARWCALFLICRNMLVAVIPTVPDAVYQVVLLQAISLAGLIVVLEYQPCRIAFANISEIGLCLGTLLAGSLASFFIDDKDLDSISKLTMVIILAAAVLFPIGIVVGLFRWVRQSRQKTFHFFLCHHKAGAGALARLMKMELCRNESSLRGDVFIDSDNLDNLDKLFDFVGQETNTLVAISSAELYKRPWCVGEVTTAYNKQLRVVPLYLTDFVPLTDDFIEDITDVVDLSCVFEQGIALNNIQKALFWVRSLGGLTMPSSVSVRILRELSKALFYRSALTDKDSLYTRSIVGGKLMDNAITSHVHSRLSAHADSVSSAATTSQPNQQQAHFHSQTSAPSTPTSGAAAAFHRQISTITGQATTSRVIENKPPAAIIVDTDNSEAMCSARILLDLLAEKFGDAGQAPVLLSDAMLDPSKSLQLLPSVSRLAMICTVGCWSSLPFLMDAVHGYWAGLEMLPVVVDEGYKYPTESFYLELDDFGSRRCRMFDVDENPAVLRGIVAYVFKNIASHFHVLGSMALLHTQAENIVRRLKGGPSPVSSARKQSEQDERRQWCAEFVQAICENSMGALRNDGASVSFGIVELFGKDVMSGGKVETNFV